MNRPHVDYDRIAPHYNRRFVDEQRGGVRAALVGLATSIGARRILEAGCGTAHWLDALRTGLPGDSHLCGLDLSAGMLDQARQRDGAPDLIQAAAEYIPIKRGTFDLVYCVNAIHHFSKPQAFIFAARRVLRPGGTLAVIGSDPRGRHAKWYVYDFFPGTFQRDLERFPAWSTVESWMLASGFQGCSMRQAEHIHAPKFGTDVLNDPYLEKNATSQLALLSEGEYAAGIEQIKNAITLSERSDEELVFHSDIFLHILQASAPE